MGLGPCLEEAGTGLGMRFRSAAMELRARGHGRPVTPSPVTLSFSATASPCQPTTLSPCHRPMMAVPAGRCDLLPKFPQPQRFRGRAGCAAHLTSESGTSSCCPPALAVLWCPAPHPSHHCLHSPLPGGLGVFWPPCSITLLFRARWAAPAASWNLHLSGGTLPFALPPHLAPPRHPGPVLHPSNTH